MIVMIKEINLKLLKLMIKKLIRSINCQLITSMNVDSGNNQLYLDLFIHNQFGSIKIYSKNN